MKTAELEPNPGRRGVLAGTAALLVGGAAAAAISASPALADDAELLALCARAESLYRRFHDFYAGGAHPIADEDEREVALQPLYDAEEDIGHEIFNMTAKTLAAHQARARVVLAYHGDFDDFKNSVVNHGTDGRVLAALIRDLTAEFVL